MDELGYGKKLTTADLWHMYRHPASIDALIPVAIVLEALSDKKPNGTGSEQSNFKGVERALRCSQGIAAELTKRCGFDDSKIFLHFEGGLIPIENGFYAARLKAYCPNNENSPQYKEMEKFVRETYANNMVIPFSKLIWLNKEGHIPLPAALKRRYVSLTGVAKTPGGAQFPLGQITRASTTKVEQAAEFFAHIDLTAEHEIGGRLQKIDAENAGLFAKERGFDVGKTNAYAAVRQHITPRRGRPRKVLK